MSINTIMSSQLSQLQHTVNLSLLAMAKNTQTAGATMMLEDFAKTQATIQQASHPVLGKNVDVRI